MGFIKGSTVGLSPVLGNSGVSTAERSKQLDALQSAAKAGKLGGSFVWAERTQGVFNNGSRTGTKTVSGPYLSLNVSGLAKDVTGLEIRAVGSKQWKPLPPSEKGSRVFAENKNLDSLSFQYSAQTLGALGINSKSAFEIRAARPGGATKPVTLEPRSGTTSFWTSGGEARPWKP